MKNCTEHLIKYLVLSMSLSYSVLSRAIFTAIVFLVCDLINQNQGVFMNTDFSVALNKSVCRRPKNLNVKSEDVVH